MAKLTSAPRVIQSYLARLPSSARLRFVQAEEKRGSEVVGEAGHCITGTLGYKKVDIFARPARVIEDFANTIGNPENILRFTRNYGVLHGEDRLLGELPEYIVGDPFRSDCNQWLMNQERFRTEWERKGKPDEDLANSLAEQIDPKSQVGPAIKAMVRPARNGGFQLELRPDDLLGALWLAFLGFSGKTRKCQNPTCSAPYFIATRRDQKYCNEQCSRLVANRRWWDQHGAEWRRDHKTAKKSKGAK
jgi:hypothetical protein